MGTDRAFLNVIGGGAAPAVQGGAIPVINPSDGLPFATIARGTDRDIDAGVVAARGAFEAVWQKLPALERGRLLAKLGARILEHHAELAEFECLDTGKPIHQAKTDITACARYFEFYGGAADKLHGETIPYSEGFTVFALREPYGVTGHIIPWNYPAQILGRTVGASLAAGNACVVKPAEDACLSVVRIAELALECGLPAGVFNVITGFGAEAGAALASHPGVDHLSFTGSPPVGTLIAQAAAANHIPAVLELGGKSPHIVFEDADLDQALPAMVNSIVQNAGQTCSAGSRALIARSIYDRTLGLLSDRFQALKTGPGPRGLDCGPLISRKQFDRVSALVDQARRDGATVVATGRIVNDAPNGGFYFPPTLLSDVPLDHPVAQEEVFGPVLAAFAFEDEDDAVRIANGTRYGLTTGVWTRDGSRQLRLARRIAAGQVFINNYGAGGGIELPFGGMKHSGYGREKGFEGMRGFTQVKTVAIRH
ncbi:MAG: aldehyde dehydrogenase family protein [Candidatus Eremiobacteraeota bacterium]|nr:aldehyde dehydrogenase family protein [Candidatus Eremiobacteraeota bacterium]